MGHALAPDQRAAATAPPGPVLCVAPAGSGKTATLVARIAWLIGGPVRADPARICAVTFNRRAAEELRSRLAASLTPIGIEPDAVRVRTFHALGREILVDAGVDVSNLCDRPAMLRTLFPDRSTRPLQALDDAFARLKVDLQAPLDALRALANTTSADRPMMAPTTVRLPRWLDAGIASAYLAYQAALQEQAALDFDDLVIRALDVLRSDANLLAQWRRRCAHLLVDEVQDLDRSQLDLAVLLAGAERRIFLVGDDDQTIYAWRLADVRRVIGLAERLPGLRRFDLTVNYRCPAPVVERAVRLVSHNRERFRKRVRARPDASGSLLLAALPTDDVTRARRLLGRWVEEGLPRSEDGGVSVHPESHWAVLARTNAELAPFAAVALELGISFRAEEHRLLLEDPRVDAFIAEAASIGGAQATPLTALGRLRTTGETDPSVDAAATDELPNDNEAVPRDTLVASLLPWAAPFPTLSDLRAAIEESRRRLAVLHRDDAPLVLATVHGTKGLEFDHVAVVGLDEGRFPSRRSLEEAEDRKRALEEERRLAYVAWTRARRSLTLVHDPGAPSTFLHEAFSRRDLSGELAGQSYQSQPPQVPPDPF